MKINARHFPTIIIATFVLFLIIAILLGFQPVHSGGTPDEQTTSALINLCESI
jgi:hypothetical protein